MLCVAVMLSVMVLGAGAAFSDQDQIEHAEAVEMATALNIISGYEDGSYHPERNIKRSEMCKMICIALNGGKEPATSTKDQPTFTDIDGHWAEGYIEYCYTKGVVSGVGGGRFNPDGNVTVSQAAKMLLVALGYNAEVEQFVGGNWSLYVNVKANQDGLYKDLEGIDTADAITRDQAAQMVWNTMQAKVIEKTSSIDVTTGDVTESYKKGEDTMLKDGYNATIYEGVLRASGSVAPYGETAGKDKLNVLAEYVDGDLIRDKDGNALEQAYVLNGATDYTGLIGEYTKVVYSNKDKKVLGVFAVEDETTVVVNTTRGDMGVIKANDVDVEINDVTYDFCAAVGKANDPEVYVATSTGWSEALALNDSTAFGNDNRNDAQVKMVDNDGDGKIDVVFVVDVLLKDVNYVGSDQMTLSGIGVVKNSDMNLADSSYTTDDKVIVTPKCAEFNGNYGIAKAEVVEGKVESVRRETVNKQDNVVTEVQVDGKWYTLVATSTSADLATAGSVVQDDKDHALALDGTYKLYVRGNYVYAADIVTAGAVEIGMITGAVKTNTDFDGNTWCRLLKADGTTVEAYMNWAEDIKISSTPYAPTDGLKAGQLVTYTVEDDVYTLYPAGAPLDDTDDAQKALGGYDAATGIGAKSYVATTSPAAYGDPLEEDANSNLTIAGKRISNDAVVFVEYDSDMNTAGLQSAWKVVSGKDVNAWNISTSFGKQGGGLYNTTGMGYLEVAVISMDNTSAKPLPGTSTQYAYVTSSISYTGSTATYSIWDGSGTEPITVSEKKTGTEAAKGAVISFDWDGDGVIKNVKKISSLGALTVTTGDQVSINGTGYDLTDDTVILNVDTANKIGVPGKDISVAAKDADGKYYQNVTFVTDATDPSEITLLVVDVVNNKWDGGTIFTPASTVDSTADVEAVKAMDDGVYTPSSPTNLPSGVSGGVDDVLMFKFTARVVDKSTDSLNYTLRISEASTGTEQYSETASFQDNSGGHYFYVRALGTKGDVTTGVVHAGLTAETLYTFTVTGADGVTYLNGSFVTPKA